MNAFYVLKLLQGALEVSTDSRVAVGWGSPKRTVRELETSQGEKTPPGRHVPTTRDTLLAQFTLASNSTIPS